MVVFPDYNPSILNAYSTVPVTPNITYTVLSAVWEGTYARFGTPKQAVQIHDRSDFYNRSHYEIRTRLDHEGMVSDFMVITNRTMMDNAAWVIVSTEKAKAYTEHAVAIGSPPVTYPGENSTIWQIYMRTVDIPSAWAANDGGWGGAIPHYFFQYSPKPYDPHRPQLPPYYLGWNWTDGSLVSVNVHANYSEVEFGTLYELPAARLKKNVAREYGLLQDWSLAFTIPEAEEPIWMYVPYNWTDPRWPKKFPGLDQAHNIGS